MFWYSLFHFSVDFRSLAEFLSLSNCSLPRDAKTAQERVYINLQYFTANYAALVFLCLLILCIVKPTFFFGLSISIGVGLFLFRCGSIGVNGQYHLDLKLGSGDIHTLSLPQLELAFSVILTLLFSATGGYHSFYVILFGLLLCLIHALLRQRSIKARGTVGIKEAIGSIGRKLN